LSLGYYDCTFSILLSLLLGYACVSALRANAILGVSLAVARAGAASKGIPLYRHFGEIAGNTDKFVLPVPSFNVINGGSHAGNRLAFQEFMILPTGASSFTEAMLMGSEIYHHLKGVIKKKYGQDATNVGDEGGFAPNIQSNVEGVELLMSAIEKSGYAGKITIGMDVAASEFLNKDGTYNLDFKNANASGPESALSGEGLAQMYADLCKNYPIHSIEDPFDQVFDFPLYAFLPVLYFLFLLGHLLIRMTILTMEFS
jgi:enolase